jgi:molybdate transport system ATP-binding protein
LSGQVNKNLEESAPGPGFLEAHLTKSYGSFRLTADFKLVEPGITVISGPSGAGKTTLLNLLAGLSRPDWGYIRGPEKVYFDSNQGICAPPEKRNISYVFQRSRLFSHFSVKNNLLFASRFGNRPLRPGSWEKVVSLLGLTALLGRRPHTLSGGEAQRVAIGRALLAEGDLLLMDEPLSSLDRERKTELLGYIAKIPERLGVPILYVTHAEEELLALAQRVLEVFQGQCRWRETDARAENFSARAKGGDL